MGTGFWEKVLISLIILRHIHYQQITSMLSLNKHLRIPQLKGNIYQNAALWLGIIDNYFSEVEKDNNICGLSFKNLDHAREIITSQPEQVTVFLNKEIPRRHNIDIFIGRITKTGHTITIPKSSPNDAALYEAGTPSFLSEQQAIELCEHYIELCRQLEIAENALITFPEKVSETWPVILPANADLLQIAQLLSRSLTFETRMAAYRFAVAIDEREREFFFRDTYYDLFEYTNTKLRAFERTTFEPLVKNFIPWLSPVDFDALVRSTIRHSYGDSIFETWWAFIRLHIAEILLTDYNICLSDNVYDDVVGLSLNELDDMVECCDIIEWDYQPEWTNMVNALAVLVVANGFASQHLSRLEHYIKIKSDYLKSISQNKQQ